MNRIVTRPRRLLLIIAALAVVSAGLFAGWNVFIGDRGNVLLLASEDLPGQSGRVSRRSIERYDDPAALRDRVDERTGAIIIDEGRLDELGDEWLAERFDEGVVIAAVKTTREDLGGVLAPSAGIQDPADAQPDVRTVIAGRRCGGSSFTNASYPGFLNEFFTERDSFQSLRSVLTDRMDEAARQQDGC